MVNINNVRAERKFVKDASQFSMSDGTTEGFKQRMIAELREIYDTEMIDGVDSAGDEEMQLLELAGSTAIIFEDATFDDICKAIDLMVVWHEILNPV